MPELSRLLEDHAKLMTCAESLLATVSGPESAPDEAIRQLGSLAASLDRHLRLEGDMIRRAQEAGTSALIPLTEYKGKQFHKLVDDWVGYLNGWPEAEIKRNWLHFCSETLPIIRRVIGQIEAENEAVRTIVAHAGGQDSA